MPLLFSGRVWDVRGKGKGRDVIKSGYCAELSLGCNKFIALVFGELVLFLVEQIIQMTQVSMGGRCC